PDISSLDRLPAGIELLVPPSLGLVVTLQPGESLLDVVERHGVAPGDLVRANELRSPFDVAPGMMLFLPGVRPTEAMARLEKVREEENRYVWPLHGRLTSYFGPRNLGMGTSSFHRGIDVAAPWGTPVVAARSGTVTFAGWSTQGYGNLVKVRHSGGDETWYGHFSSIAVSVGQHVKQGQVIGYVGSTGISTGPHLHFELYEAGRAVDPLSMRRCRGPARARAGHEDPPAPLMGRGLLPGAGRPRRSGGATGQRSPFQRIRPQLGQRVTPSPRRTFCTTWIGSFTRQPPQLWLFATSTSARPRRAARTCSYCLSSGLSTSAASLSRCSRVSAMRASTAATRSSSRRRSSARVGCSPSSSAFSSSCSAVTRSSCSRSGSVSSSSSWTRVANCSSWFWYCAASFAVAARIAESAAPLRRSARDLSSSSLAFTRRRRSSTSWDLRSSRDSRSATRATSSVSSSGTWPRSPSRASSCRSSACTSLSLFSIEPPSTKNPRPARCGRGSLGRLAVAVESRTPV